MNRVQVVQAVAACEALAKELRRTLNADARAEYEEQGMAPTWRMPGYTVSTSVTQPGIEVVSETDWLGYVRENYPTEVETIVRARPAWQADFLSRVATRGEPPCDDDGRVIPGLQFRPGGEFKSVSLLPGPATKDALKAVAEDIASGKRPLGLPMTVEVYE